MANRVVVAILAAVFMLIVLFGYVFASDRADKQSQSRIIYSSIVMPDGSVITGECSGYDRNDRYVTVYMEDRVYKVSDWRVAIWYERGKEQYCETQ